MSWHYQVRHRVDNGEDLYDIVEVYDNPIGWTKDSIAPLGETKRELLDTLNRMISDAVAYPVLEDVEVI